MSLDACRLIDLPRMDDERGSLSFLQSHDPIPFRLERMYYLYDVASGAERGAHAHRALEQLIIAMHGSFTVNLDDGRFRRSFTLDVPYQGLYVAPMMWRTLSRFSSGAVCCVLASLPYDEADYIRDYETFRTAVETSG